MMFYQSSATKPQKAGSSCWVAQLDSAGVPTLQARHRYFVLGTWTSWTCFEMSPTEPNCFETTLRIGMSGMESFRFLRDQDPPDRNTAGGRESHGPHEGGHTV